MPDFNRRHIMQLASAAGLAPALAALPGRATVAAPAVASHAQLLWASLYARAGSTSGLAQVAQTMGMSAQTAAGMSAKVAGVRVLATKGAVRQTTRRIDLRKWLADDPVETAEEPETPAASDPSDDT